MYIEPNSTIELFRDLRFDNSYSNTMWFANATAQNNFFTQNYYVRYNSYSYQRKDIGVIRIEAPISSLFAVNYMRFKNTSFENKWFYAFVTRVEYINNVTCALYYTIDVIQTYMFDWTLHQCMIERQHSTTDVAGDNLIPEGLELGDYINSDTGIIFNPNVATDNYSYLICVGCTDSMYDDLEQYADESAYFQLVAYQFTAIAYLKCDQGGEGSPIDILDYLNDNNQIGAIVSITFIPKSFSLNEVTHSRNFSVNKPASLNGYAPINKKMLTYPYCYLDIYNDQNEHEELRFELFSTANCGLKMYDIVSANPEAILLPQNYNNITQTPETGLSISGFPQIPYFNDAYKAWLALNYDQMAVSRQITAQETAYTKQGLGISQKQLTANTLVSEFQQGANVGGALAKGNIAGALSAGAGMVGTGLNYMYDTQKNDLANTRAEYDYYSLLLRQSADESRARNLPNSSHVGSTSSAVSANIKGFWYNIKTVRRQYAERIDKYFTMFGYAQKLVAVPNIHARQYFTYIKTNGSCVTGLIPQDDREVIDTIFNRGIRFWTDYTHFEDYTVNNAII